MKKYCLIALSAAFMLSLIPTLEASPHRHSKRNRRQDDGLALAAGIVHLVRSVIAPPTVVVTPRPVVVVPPRPVVIHPPRRVPQRPLPPPRRRRR